MLQKYIGQFLAININKMNQFDKNKLSKSQKHKNQSHSLDKIKTLASPTFIYRKNVKNPYDLSIYHNTIFRIPKIDRLNELPSTSENSHNKKGSLNKDGQQYQDKQIGKNRKKRMITELGSKMVNQILSTKLRTEQLVGQSLGKLEISKNSERNSPIKKLILPSTIHFRRQFTRLSGLDKCLNKVLEDQTQLLVTAKKWAIFDISTNLLIKGYKSKKQHDVASLSKIITFYTAYMIIAQFYLSLDKTELIVDELDENIMGTKINVKKQDIVGLGDMLYALLMSSSNNAATIIAKNLGSLIIKKNSGKYFSCFDLVKQSKEQNLNSFMQLVQKSLKDLNVSEETVMNNPHGMYHNYSSAIDIAKITAQCFKIPLFCQIVNTKKKIIYSKSINDFGELIKKPILLENTNKLLEKESGCIGGKTGCNNLGGQSLVACFQGRILVVILGAAGKDQKFMDCETLIQWLRKKVQQ